jgi:monoamine oxidase
MEQSDILIIGAGVCGMAAARELAKQGKRVVILEAMSRTGGRVSTFQWHFQKAEAGPEFIHGDLPLTKQLVEEARGAYVPYEAEVYRSKAGRIHQAEDFVPHMQKVLKAFESVEQDCTLDEFLETHFTGDEHRELRLAVIRQAEGFDVADPKRVSVFALRDEWSQGHEDTYLIKEGYNVLTDHLAKSCRKAGVLILLAKEVNSIQWQKGSVILSCSDGSVYGAAKLIVTVSLGMLTAKPGSKGHIRFSPEIPHLLYAAQQMGFGNAIKVLLAFRTRFWLSEEFREQQGRLSDFGFLISDGAFPVFWTGNEAQFPVLTAWAGGSRAEHLEHFNADQLVELAISSLAHAFGCSETLLKSYLFDHKVFNWSDAPYVRGAYSYSTVHTEEAKELFASPLLHTLYFAGEAFGNTMGTVEAALESAAAVVKRML